MEKVIVKNNMLQFTKLLEYEEILKHCISLKPIDIGNSIDNNISSYEKVCDFLQLDFNNIYRPCQTHTDNVVCVDDFDAGIFTKDLKDVDGLITNRKNKILTISTADCIDFMFFDPVKKIIGNTHSGWKGTFNLISKNTVEKMVDNYGCNPKDIICCIGPSIRKCHFEVDGDVAEKFYEKFKVLDNINDIILKGNRNKYNIDTVLINRTVLAELGLREKNIIDCELCTVCNCDKFHSYRVDREMAGRNAGIITLI